MTKEQAAKVLGISPRSVIRFAQRGRLSVRYAAKENGGKVALYDPTEIEALKAEIEAEKARPRTPPPVRQAESLALVSGDKAGTLAEILSKLTEASASKAQPVALSEKLTLSLSEAVKLSGLSESFLREALKAGRLSGVKGSRARGWNIKASDLRGFVESL